MIAKAFWKLPGHKKVETMLNIYDYADFERMTHETNGDMQSCEL